MDTIKIRTGIFVAAIFLCVLAAPVKADWEEYDGHKMHFPQLPDLNGWDVASRNWTTKEPLLLADDWTCSETGWVTDIHIWGSWLNDSKGEIEYFDVSIWSNEIGENFSYPGEIYWRHNFTPSEFHEIYWDNGTQGVLSYRSYSTGLIVDVSLWDHNDTYLYNLHINNLSNAWLQQNGTTYWLAIAPHFNTSEYWFGWKTSYDDWQGKFVVQTDWRAVGDFIEGMWFVGLRPPQGSNQSLAFVIAGQPLGPEPEPPAPAPEVPAFTPLGLIALVSLLSAIAAVTIVRKRR